MRLTGWEAIEWARENDGKLNKYSDPTEGAREGISIEFAKDVASEDPGLVWADVDPSASAKQLGKEFAEYLKTNSGIENWSPLDREDPLPSEDYVQLREKFGNVTEEMEAAYRKGFNSVS